MSPHHEKVERRALDASQYDAQWRELGDFSRFNPGVRHRRRMILDLVSEVEARSVVDVGCGPGQLLRALALIRPELELTGVDLSPEVIAENSRLLPGFAFHVLDLEDRPMSEQFDLVVCSEVIEHLDDWRIGISHLVDMVAPGGHLLVTCPTGRIYETEVSFGHVEHPEKAALRNEIEARGLRTLALQQWGFPMYRLAKFATNVNAEWAGNNFGTSDYRPWQRMISSMVYWVTRASLPDHPWGCQLVGLFRRV